MGRAKQGLSAASAVGRRRTQALQAGNMMVVRDLLARATEWHQQYREITENSIQAVLASADGHGQVVWKPAEDLAAQGVMKYACIDQGQGMTGPDMVRFLNTLAESGRSQGVGHNHGVGAKITMMAANKEGVEVRSWVGGKGNRVLLTPDGIVELRPGLAAPHCYFEPLPDGDARKPAEIDEHGTMVVLLGNSPEDDSTGLPEQARKEGYGEKWMSRYLNAKYLSVPDGVDLTVHEKRTVRPVLGAQKWLDRVSLDHGEQAVGDAKVRWWLLKEKEDGDGEFKRSTLAGQALVDAHVALNSGKETYCTRKGAEGRSLLREAGLLYGSGRVALHVEPNPQEWMANAERTKLYNSDGQEYDVREVLRAFSGQLPDTLAAFVEEEAAKEAAQFDPNAAIQGRLNQYADLLHTLHKPAKDGQGTTEGWTTSGSGTADGDAHGATIIDFSTLGPRKPRKRNTETAAHNDKPKRPRAKKAMVVPDIPEVVVEDDDSYPAIASFDETHNQVLFNTGAEPIRRVIDQLAAERIRETRATGGRRKAIEDKVRAVVIEALSAGVVETILNTRGTASTLGWNDEQLGKALSDEALSAAALQVTNKMQAIQSAIGAAFGRVA